MRLAVAVRDRVALGLADPDGTSLDGVLEPDAVAMLDCVAVAVEDGDGEDVAVDDGEVVKDPEPVVD